MPPHEPETLQVWCPECGGEAAVGQVQGDRCPGCNFEFKWFAPGEQHTAVDYLQALTGRKHYLVLRDEMGYLVAHE